QPVAGRPEPHRSGRRGSPHGRRGPPACRRSRRPGHSVQRRGGGPAPVRRGWGSGDRARQISGMSGDVLIGIDAGSSVIKSVAFTPAGEQIAMAAVPNRYEAVAGGGVEQDMLRTWTDTAATLRQLGERVPDLARRVLAVCVTGQGDGTWLID